MPPFLLTYRERIQVNSSHILVCKLLLQCVDRHAVPALDGVEQAGSRGVIIFQLREKEREGGREGLRRPERDVPDSGSPSISIKNAFVPSPPSSPFLPTFWTNSSVKAVTESASLVMGRAAIITFPISCTDLIIAAET